MSASDKLPWEDPANWERVRCDACRACWRQINADRCMYGITGPKQKAEDMSDKGDY